MPDLDLDWQPPLQARWGAHERLCGIRVFHDFRWRDVFPDERTQFKNGMVLAQLVKQRCPEGIVPALLLTRRADAEQGFLETDTHLLCVVNIDEYRSTEGDAATAYVASHLSVGLEQLRELTELSDLGNAEEVRALLDQHLDIEHVVEWIQEDGHRIDRVAELLGTAGEPRNVQQALDSLTGLSHLDDDDVHRLVDFTVRLTDPEQRTELLRGATTDSVGRKAASQVLHERIAERIEDAQCDLESYESLLVGDAHETDMQKFLTAHPLLFGLEYASIRPQVRGPSGSMDFVLERFDGYNDLVELKGPRDRIIQSPTPHESVGVPSPHEYRLSKPLAQALAQAMAYRDRLTRYPQAAAEFHGIANARNPIILVILGRRADLEEHQQLVLDELNRSLHRVQVLPYDVLALRTRATLENIGNYLHADAGD